MRQAGSRVLFEYWNEVRGARAAPERAQIEPAAIREVLADTFMLDVDLATGFPFRLSGTRVDALIGGAQLHRPFLSLWRRGDSNATAAMLLTVADGVCPIVAGATAYTRDRCGQAAELLLLPLRHHGKTHGRILGALIPARRPSWFGLIPVEHLTLDSFRVIDADFDASVEPARHAPSPPAGRRHGHLRVLDGGLSAAPC